MKQFPFFVLPGTSLILFSSFVAQAEPTFNKDIAPIIFEHCAGCHRPGQAGPFNLLTYADVSKRARQVSEVVQKRVMPPWLPEKGHADFVGDRSLSKEKIELIQKWYAAGAQEGAPADLPPMPRLPEGWELGNPDLVVEMPEAYALAGEGKDVYRNFVFPIPTSQRKFVKGVELNPGNRKVVHHAFINVDTTPFSRHKAGKSRPPGFDGMLLPETALMPGGQSLGWQPGKTPRFSPEGLPWVLETNTDLVLQLHMHPSGKPEQVRPRVAFYFTDKPPTNMAYRINLNPLIIDIPPGSQDYAIEDSYRLPVDVDLIGISPHAHYICKRMEGRATFPDGRTSDLIVIPNWDFNWQGDYQYSQPVLLPKGTTLGMRFTYDNSTNNIRNPNNPPKRIRYGLETTEEMGELWFQVVPRKASERNTLAQDFYHHLALITLGYNEHVLIENPKDAEAHTRAGRVQAYFGQVNQALEHFKAAIQADPNYDRAWYEVGFINFRLNRMKEAQEAFENTVRLNPDDYSALGSLGAIAMQRGEFEQAETRFRAALKINPADSVARDNLERVLKARAR